MRRSKIGMLTCGGGLLLLAACESGYSPGEIQSLMREQDCSAATPPSGSVCVMEYNGALVGAGQDACCFAAGGVNHCDTGVRCNAASGEGCCLIYATENLVFGSACCLYANGATPYSAEGRDITEECGGMLQARDAAGVQPRCALTLEERLVRECAAYPWPEMERFCAVDASGQIHALFHGDNGPIAHVPNDGRMRAAFWLPLPLDPSRVTTEGPDATVRAWAAPYLVDVEGESTPPCCPEDEEGNRLPVEVRVEPDGLLWVEAPLAPGFTQVVVDLDIKRLLPALQTQVRWIWRWYVE